MTCTADGGSIDSNWTLACTPMDRLGDVARAYRLARSTVWSIVQRKTWKHIM